MESDALNMRTSDHRLRESVIEKKVKNYAEKKGWTVRKFTSPGKRAVCDNLFMRYPAIMFYIEFKAPRKNATKAQKLEHGEMRHCGFNCYVVDNVGMGMEIIDAETLKAKEMA